MLETECADTIEVALGHYRQRFGSVGLYENQVYDGIPELLADLRRSGFELHVATSKPHVFANEILRHFELAPHFSSVSGSELDGTRDAKSLVIRHAMESSGMVSAVMIGDREHDVRGAAENGIPCIGVLYGYGDRDELSGAIQVCETPSGLGDAIRTLSSAT